MHPTPAARASPCRRRAEARGRPVELGAFGRAGGCHSLPFVRMNGAYPAVTVGQDAPGRTINHASPCETCAGRTWMKYLNPSAALGGRSLMLTLMFALLLLLALGMFPLPAREGKVQACDMGVSAAEGCQSQHL